MTSLSELREQIDEIDARLVDLLNQRADVVLNVREVKKESQQDIYSPVRERQILERVCALAEGGHFPKGALEKIFTNVVSATRSLMGELSVAYLGPEFSLAFEAAGKQFGRHVKLTPGASVDEILRHVSDGESHFAVIPLEMASGALAASSIKSLLAYPLSIVAEIEVSVFLSLYSGGMGLQDVQQVYSDAESFFLAANWLKANIPGAELTVVPNLAIAAKKAQRHLNSACVVSEALGEKYGLTDLASKIVDDGSKIGRFAVVGEHESAPSGRDKTSLICQLEDKSGALHRMLKPFADNELSLSKIESRALGGSSANQMFFVEFFGHRKEASVIRALEQLGKCCSELKVLGSYPVAHDSSFGHRIG